MQKNQTFNASIQISAITLALGAFTLAACGGDGGFDSNGRSEPPPGTFFYGDVDEDDDGDGAGGDGDGDGDGDPGEEENPSEETYAEWIENDWVQTDADPMSTFSADVDTASYSMMRRDLNAGHWPDPQSVRIEEYLNYFRYTDPAPEGDEPFNIALEVSPSPFGDEADPMHLLRIGIQGEVVPYEERDPVNLVFLIDVSGSMTYSTKLPLVKYTLSLLIDKLAPTDTLGIVVYAGTDGVVLEPTPVQNKSAILDALDALQSGGGTNGEAGIRAAYDMAEDAFREDGVNRVVLCTDGDFNVGATGTELVNIIEDFRERDIFLSIFGYGGSNYNDSTGENLSNHGNGNYVYIDSPNEALHVVGENLVSTLQVIAKDVKLQVEFDPAQVERFRLLGYENRLLAHEDFNNDAVDAGDLGAGHHVTALYELDLRDDAKSLVNAGTAPAAPIATLRVRHKKPVGDLSELQERAVHLDETQVTFDEASTNLRWAAAVAEYAEILRGSMHSEGADFAAVRALAESGAMDTPSHAEFLTLVDIAADLSP